MSRQASWPDEWVAVLREEWPKSHVSATDLAEIISAKFGVQVNRNQVIGQVHRRKIKKPKKLRMGGPRSPPQRKPLALVPKVPRKEGDAPALASGSCRYIDGDPQGEHSYCGNPVNKPGSSYCAAHYAVVYRGKTWRYSPRS